MNKKQLAAEQMKHRFIEVTIEIVGTLGLSKLTASALSQKTGASKGALYHHFENLDAVRLAALQSLIDGFLFIDEEETQFPTLESYLTYIGEQTFSVMEQRPIEVKALMAFIQQAMFEPAFRDDMKRLIQGGFQRYTEVIRQLFPSLSDTQIATVVQIIDAHFGGSMMHWYLLDNPEQCRENWRSFCKIICYSLKQGGI